MITGSRLGFKSSLCDAEAGWCLDGMFRRELKILGYLVKEYAPLDSQISVSSVFKANYGKDKVRLDYNGESCARIKADSDSSPWVKFDLLCSRVATGVEIAKRCDSNGEQYVEVFDVSTSADDITWSYVGTDVQIVYESLLFTWLFDKPVSARYWRIEPKYPAKQADFLGYI